MFQMKCPQESNFNYYLVFFFFKVASGGSSLLEVRSFTNQLSKWRLLELRESALKLDMFSLQYILYTLGG